MYEFGEQKKTNALVGYHGVNQLDALVKRLYLLTDWQRNDATKILPDVAREVIRRYFRRKMLLRAVL